MDDLELLTAKSVGEAAAQGDELAQDVLNQAAGALGLGIANAVNLMNPQRVTIGGGVAKIGSAWIEEIRSAARAAAMRDTVVDIVPGALGDDAPLWGAIVLASGVAS
jgi:glucokinase